LIKRIFDITAIILLSVLWIPTIIVIAILNYFFMGTPILFKQDRGGQNCYIFTIYKFRTMKIIITEKDFELKDKERLTKFGKFLRKTSLDELPSLWNVLKGDMSLVGPRPLIADYLTLYNNEQFKRHEVRPGITGWAQISGRNNLTWEEKFELDIWYINNRTFFLDIKILLLTIIKVFKFEGVNQSEDETMEKFSGTRNR